MSSDYKASGKAVIPCEFNNRFIGSKSTLF